ncbi:transposase InsO family protein [Aminobacter aminovorans]|uniref:Integrase n=1 Tax=Aminobacter aminovorans TaxID=83263 RepID=A0AAC8YVU1_AMIAI|nr:integrase [Aminobacter aminovorans]MBB3708649.1 transposase InsO family protein [Aminobacter aminovorans]
MSTVAKVLSVSRSNLIERTGKPSKPRGPYRKPDDLALLAELRPIIDERPTYGYRRVTALLNRQRRNEGKSVVNAKRVLRVMQQNGLTLQKHTALRPTRTHDGVVVALRSNIRWCSDHGDQQCLIRSMIAARSCG